MLLGVPRAREEGDVARCRGFCGAGFTHLGLVPQQHHRYHTHARTRNRLPGGSRPQVLRRGAGSGTSSTRVAPRVTPPHTHTHAHAHAHTHCQPNPLSSVPPPPSLPSNAPSSGLACIEGANHRLQCQTRKCRHRHREYFLVVWGTELVFEPLQRPWPRARMF